MDRPPHVGIILVNWNGLSDTLECVRSCLRLDGPRFRIVIVDNGSSDGSCQTLAASFAAVALACFIVIRSVPKTS